VIYLFDTNTVSFMLERTSPAGSSVLARYDALGEDDSVVISVLALYELATLAALKPQFSELQAQTIAQMDIIDVPAAASTTFARLKVGLARKTGAKIAATGRRNFDLILAAMAIEGGYALVSNDKVFSTLAEVEPALRLEDWTK
jgi:predicted nucleic acid-binding protein